MRPYLPSPPYGRNPIRWPVQPNLQTQIQQIKAASQSSSLSPVAVAPVTSANMPKAVQNVGAAVKASGSQRVVTVRFTRSPDPFYQAVNVYLRQGNQQPVLVASSPTSPISFSVSKTLAASTVFVQTQGNWGPMPLSSSPSAALRLA